MPQYEPTQRIIALSLEELNEIIRYLHEKNDNLKDSNTVLIGGWAVDSYNPWFGSIDIDLITSSKIRKSIMFHLRENRDFKPYRLPGISTSVQKMTDAGPVIIDFATWQKPFLFEGIDDDYLDFRILKKNTEMRTIRGGIEMTVPTREALIILKLKAIWDRQYRIDNLLSHDPLWESGKLIKDRADVLALLDPGHGGRELDIYVFAELLKKHSFLEQSLRTVYETNEGIEKYGRLSQNDSETLIKQLLSLVK
ncbi:hypothetical protein SAMN04488589_1845 [Methanolobus vulcani]|uniref:Nucleotidyl transferase AbiEii toxin, Type IV TA system n=1 Tax=Methanolobus vulcani TaxID=38026 RepID=A0A7Z7FD00_9EURY|nr:hypothetical protein [Methanolobus vulcani]SDF96551.1 hypothetical protein SAMN04488589_1845 [Methanolobus vulcani]